MSMEAWTDQELAAAIDAHEEALKPLKAEQSKRWLEQERACLARCDSGSPPFEASELVFARDSKCQCGEKLAYPKDIGPRGFWDCAGLLKRTAPPKGHPDAKVHTDRLPFTFWNIKAEGEGGR